MASSSARSHTLDRVRSSARKLERERKATRGFLWLGFIVLTLASVNIGAVHGALVGLGLFSTLGAALGWYGRRSIGRARDGSAALGIPDAVRTTVAALPPSLPEAVEWRLDRALHAVHHLSSLLEHAPFGSDLPDVEALRRDAQTCLERVVDRCEALADLYAVHGPSDAVLTARKSVQREIDDHLVSLSGAMDAVASYVAVGTGDAVQALRDRAHHLHAIADNLRELDASSTLALPPPQTPS